MNTLKVPRKIFIGDMIAGLVMAIIQVPGAVANGVLAGVNPIFGLYSMIAGTTVAAIFTSSVIMNVDSTRATALATSEALAGISTEEQLGFLVVLGILVGIFMLGLGLLKLGFLVRFVSNSVMTGFLSGLGVLTILGQVGYLTGFYSQVENKVLRTLDTLVNFREVDPATLMIGLLTIIIIIAVKRTRFDSYSLVAALVATTALVPLMALDSIALVGDITEIPRSLPIPKLPNLTLIPSMIVPALSITIIALVQASGVSQSVPNPDGNYPDLSGDFLGQGIANIIAGSTGAIPVGGSLSGTTLIRSIGGISRWANIFTGLFGAIIVLLFAPLIEVLPMPALAGMLIMVGVSMIQTHRIHTVWNTGPAPVMITLITFAFTLFTAIQVAVFVGVVLHIMLYVFRSAEAVRIERIIPQPDGGYIEGFIPKELNSNQIIILQPIGNLFFAGAAEFEEHLPEVGEAQHAVVILRLRDRDEVGSTFIRILERFAGELHKQDNLLILVGLNKKVIEQLEKTNLLAEIGEKNVFSATERFGDSLGSGIFAAEAWIKEKKNSDN